MQLQVQISRLSPLGCGCVSYLVAALAVKKDPANFDYFCRVFGHVDTMFVASRGYVDHHISVRFWSS